MKKYEVSHLPLAGVKEYFDSVASIYEKRRKRLQLLKEAEKQAVIGALDVKRGELVLDAGCGTGFYSLEIIKRGGRVFGVDISPKMVAKAKASGVNAVVGNLEVISYKQRFDKALFAGSLEFCVNPRAAIKNSAKALKKNGALVLIAPPKSVQGLFYALFHLTHGFRIKLFSKKGLQQMLREAGMRVLFIRKTTPLSVIVKAVKR